MEENNTLLETTRVSRSKSFRISLPRRVADRMEVGPDDIIGFYSNSSGEIIIRKLV